MTEETTPAVATNDGQPAAPTTEATVTAAPVVEAAPVAAPAAEAAAPSQKTETPAAETAPAQSTVLGEPEKTTETKPAETAKPAAEEAKPVEGEAKPEEGSQSAEPAPLPTYEPFTAPEGVTLDDEQLTAFTQELGEFQNSTKADQAQVQAFGQKLVDRAIALQQDTAKRVADLYQASWEKQKNDWKDAFEKDPEIGGNRKDTTALAAQQFIRTHAGNDEQRAELQKFFNETGIGNHPGLIRLLANANMAVSEGKPLPAQPSSKMPQSKIQRRYGNMQA